MKRVERGRIKTVIAFWLVPARPHRDLFAEMIRILAGELEAPRFEPHLTICYGPDTVNARDVLRTIAVASIRLQLKGVAATNEYTKSLFVRFARTRALDELNRKLCPTAKFAVRPIRDPHLSLLYKDVPLAAKKDLAEAIRLPFRELTFDTIKAVRCHAETRTSADVNSWRVIATKKLSG